MNMSSKLKVSSLVIKRLQNLQDGCIGRLYGISDDKSLLLIGLSLTTEELENHSKENALNDDITQNLPGGVYHCGLFNVSNNRDNLKQFDEKLLGNNNEHAVIANVSSKTKVLSFSFYKNGEYNETEFTVITENEIPKQLSHLRVMASIPLHCDLEVSEVESVFNELENKILSGNAAFQFEDKEIYILGNKQENIIGISPKSSLSELLKSLNLPNKNSDGANIFVKVHIYMNQTNYNDTPQTAPYIKYIKKEFKHAEIQVSLDALVTMPNSLLMNQFYSYLIEGTHKNLILNKKNLINQLQKGKLYDICSPETYHFMPSELGHFFSAVYSPKQTLDELKETRESFHKMLLLPMDRPLFRQGNAFDFTNSSKTSNGLLLNPHEKVPLSGVSNGEAYYVQGTYAYYHYMQDGFDDGGWGCAYRSLQTIFSWFRFQGFTNLTVPSHNDIQQCLINIGDKPKSFLGSRQWIGSTEVSFVLDTMLGVTSRIVNVSSGEEMTTKGGELSHHFKTQGTPIMIGGGVLAHTILGVDYNKNTGDIKFLILDPHYTGEENLSIILKKGWCGWKGPDFWKKNSFYNMCLPLKPKCV